MTTDKQVVDSLTTQGKTTSQEEAPPQTIIQPELAGTYGKVGPKSDMYDPIIPPAVDGGAEGIIPLANEASGKAYSDMVAAEQRRQTVQAEAMVNLAVGVVALKMSTHGMRFVFDNTGIPDKFRISITPQDLAVFQRDYVVDQELGEDGGFIISVDRR